MTSPVEEIRVECPRCRHQYDDWYRPSVNLDLDDFDDDYLRRASTATCPRCGTVAELDTLTVDGGVWTLRRRSDDVEAEVEQMEDALRARFGDDYDLLRPDVFRGSLWLQAAAWALGERWRDVAKEPPIVLTNADGTPTAEARELDRRRKRLDAEIARLRDEPDERGR